jgi:hypothetical protein
MKFRFDPNQQFQHDAIYSIVAVFEDIRDASKHI